MPDTIILRAAGVLLAAAQLAQPVPAQSGQLAPPFRILAGGEPIDVTTGHAAPYVLDFDGDGLRDLLVGEFGDGDFPDGELPDCLAAGWKKGGRFANGRLRVYRNHGTDTAPRFVDFEYLRAGGGVASVPIT